MAKEIKGIDLQHLDVKKSINKNNNVNLIFCHGLASEPRMHHDIVADLKNVNYYGLGFPGHIDVEAKFSTKELNIVYFARLLVGFLRKNNKLNNIILAGHSMGCAVIMLALKILSPSEKKKIKKIILAAPLTITTAFTALGFSKYLFTDANKIKRKEINKFLKDLFYNHQYYVDHFEDFFDLEFYKKHQKEQKKIVLSILKPTTIKKVIDAYHKFDQYEKVTFITGDKDRLVPFTIIHAYIKNFFKKAKHIEFLKAGHLLLLEHKDKYLELINQAINDVKS
ncbi:alpha/beta fold hydrolase [Mycoplasma sp. E35C]|uniref:alpha/beta fold hydrolase n=1 Tax=Mycoplasma sp. E35C TaxID=2801918 RepID=UPI001CA44DAA|nr:alpha/beta hydrolase [Mycoplasma sp. E35C]QZX49053.1 alpha/beta hydrolase [Mycoplasma sp. E35C]